MTGQILEVVPISRTVQHSQRTTPTNGDGVEDGITRMLSCVSPLAMNLVVILFKNSPDQWLQSWRLQAEPAPRRTGFIRIGETTRAPGPSEGLSARAEPFPLVTLADPTNLTGFKAAIRDFFTKWGNNGKQTVIYLDSLLPLVRSVGLNNAYNFLHTLTGRINSVNGYGYYLLQSQDDNPEMVDLLWNLVDNHIDLNNSILRRESAHE